MSEERITAVRQLLTEWEVDGLLITSETNYRWLSGFTGSNCTLLVTAEKALLGTDFRYWEQAARQAPEFELVKMGREESLAKLADVVTQSEAETLAIEGSKMSVNQFSSLRKSNPDVKLKSKGATLERLRLTKTAAELDTMRQAAAITDWAMGQVNEIVRPGMQEWAVAWELEKLMRERGADGVAFEIIVAGGPNAALAHHRPGERPLQVGDSIVIDMGAKLNGYHSDLTRSFHLGSEPDEKFLEIYNLVLKAQVNALENIKAGLTGAEMDALARDVISAAGHGQHFGHSLGHGVGLDIHEAPTVSSVNQSPIEANTVITVEPGVYIPGWGGVRIEDLVVVTDDGVEFLSHCPKNPIIPA